MITKQEYKEADSDNQSQKLDETEQSKGKVEQVEEENTPVVNTQANDEEPKEETLALPLISLEDSDLLVSFLRSQNDKPFMIMYFPYQSIEFVLS